MDDREGLDGEFPNEELRDWFESREEKIDDSPFYILVRGKIKKVSILEGAQWFSNFDNRKIDRTDISNLPNYPDGKMVSTVFLGIDHNFFGSKPILFETMIFGGKYHGRDWRYSSYIEAKKGHWQIVDCIRAGKTPKLKRKGHQ